MLTEFGKILVFIIIAAVFVPVGILTARFVRPARPTKEKYKVYECGEDPVGDPYVKFNVRFYVIALIFLIFDVEVALLFPWALVYKGLGLYGFGLGVLFIGVLALGLAYVWKKGDLKWARPRIKPLVLSEILQEKNLGK